MSRLENEARRSELYRMARALLDTFLASYDRPPNALLLDIYDTAHEVHQGCEGQEPVIFYTLGQGGNAVLKREASRLLDRARLLYRYKQVRVSRKQAQEHRKQQKSTSKPGTARSQNRYPERAKEPLKGKLYTTFAYQAESWSARHRIICKAEVSEQGDNLRFVVTNLETHRNQWMWREKTNGVRVD